MPYQIERILEIANRYEIPVIEDVAEGFCSRYNGKVLGTFGCFGILSFNGNKMITTSGGVALICPDKETADKAKWYATQAREGYPYYQHEVVGYNYRLSTYPLALAALNTQSWMNASTWANLCAFPT